MPAITPEQRDILGRRGAIYIDTEARRSTGEAGGFKPAMGVSVLGLYDWAHWRDLFGLRFATSPADVGDVLSRRPAVWIGHNLVRYDLAVMAEEGYLDELLTSEELRRFRQKRDDGKTVHEIGPALQAALERRDIEFIDTQSIGQGAVGHRPKLDGFQQAIGLRKVDTGFDAPVMARKGQWGRLFTYLGADIRGGMTVAEVFLGHDRLPYTNREGVTEHYEFPRSWLQRRAELLKPPTEVQQQLFVQEHRL